MTYINASMRGSRFVCILNCFRTPRRIPFANACNACDHLPAFIACHYRTQSTKHVGHLIACLRHRHLIRSRVRYLRVRFAYACNVHTLALQRQEEYSNVAKSYKINGSSATYNGSKTLCLGFSRRVPSSYAKCWKPCNGPSENSDDT